MREFRFSTNVFGIGSKKEFLQTCRRVEQLGYDTLFAADHLGIPAPFPTLVAAADATERLRVGTLVLNAEFWNPALLAREVATVDLLTEGRLELGLGAGHMKWEFDEAGIEWRPIGTRATRLAELLPELRRHLTADYEQLAGRVTAPRPVQRHGFGGTGPPLIIGGTGDRVLRIAAEHADIIGVAGIYQLPGKPPGTFRIGTASEADERVRFARECAGSRADAVEWHLLVQAVVETDDRETAGRELLERFGATMTLDELLDTPFVLIGTAEEMASQLRDRRERYGFSYITVHAPYLETFAPVIPLLRQPER
ncbi:LLM class F420-dependent oxidoreductase [Pseudonocardia spinosispora]|uniref:LLM class F420-dependent oxidoreductase n=1 Tax=Pseudonocardia spinosispora TaxID=103441 RepID=UPI00040520DC|nr:LLM class F420-dependent oxidoreductase [Pseudonocardia spinosispora]